MENKVKVLILRSAGTNCDKETGNAFRDFGAEVDFVHINKLIEKKVDINDYHIFVVAGGFSYGDDVSAGKVLANELIFKLKDSLGKFVESDKLVLGICNGFQVLIKTGLLPGIDGIFDKEQYATLTSNDSNKFECRWVHLKKVNGTSPFMKYVPEIINIPSAHAEGKFVVLNNEILDKIENEGLVAFRYCDEKGNSVEYPLNPNGAVNAIAGICNKKGNVLGMMPHPERAFKIWQTENWTENKEILKENKDDYFDGSFLFKSAIEYVKNKFLK